MNAITPAVSNGITVKSGENPSDMTITAGTTNPTANASTCADVTFNVSASNSGATDESPIYLTGLSETTLGSLAAPANGTTITATNCNASTASPASLSIGGSPYTCSFRTHFCGTITDVVSTPGKCTAGHCSAGKDNTTTCSIDTDCDVHCNGIQQSVTINGSGYGDEGPTDTTNLTIHPGTKTVTQCVQTTFF